MTSLRKFSIVLLVVAALAGIMAAPAQAVTLNCNQPSTATVGQPYNMPCSASGTPPYGFQVSAGLPPGLNQFATSSELSIQGTPLTAGSYTFTISVTDSASPSTMAQQQFTIVVSAAGSGGTGTGTGTITLTSFSPSTLTAGNTVTFYVYGTNFTANSVIHFNNVTFSTSYLSSGQLYATIPGSYVTSGSVPVYVSDPSTGTTATLNVPVSGSGSTGLTLSSISPTSAAVNSAPFLLTLFGSGFGNGTLINFGAYTLSGTLVNSGEMQVTIPTADVATAGTINVSVGGSNTVQFTIGGSSASGSISLTSLSQTTLTPGNSVTLYFYGANFTPSTTVHFNGNVLGITYQSSTTLYATIPGAYVTSGSLPVYLTDPTYGTSNTLYVSVGGTGSTGIISLTSVSPTTLTPSTGTSIILAGTNFTGNSIVYFAGTSVQTQFVNSTELIATIPATLVTSGTLPVYVYDPTNGTSGTQFVSVSGSGSGSGGVSLTSISPASAAVNSGPLTLNIFGSGFGAGALLSFGSSCTVSTTFVSSTQLQATIPNTCLLTSQTVNVSVGTSNSIQFVIGSGSGGSTGSLTVTCSPTTGPVTLNSYYTQTCFVSGGTAPYTWTVSNLPGGLSQSAYSGGSSVTITGTPTVSQSYAYTVLVTDSTSPTHQTGSLNITGTVGSTNSGYNITSLSPQTIAVGSSSTNLSVFGTGFSGSSIVYFNGSPLSTTFVSSTQLYGLVPSTSLTTSQNASITVNTSGNYTNALTLVIGTGSTSGGGSLSVTCTPGVGPQTVATLYSATCSATGGVQPYTWTTPSLPGYLTLSASNGSSVTITGTPPSAGFYNYTVRVTDSSSPVQTGSLQIAGEVLQTSTGTGGITITSLSPSSAPLNSAGITLTVNGSGFNSSSQVVFDGFTVVTTFLSGNQLTAVIPAGQFTFARAAQVTVSTPGVGTSNALSFIIGTGVANQISINCSPGVGPTAPSAYYAANCSVNGGTAPFNWSISAGSLPSGLTFSANGVTSSITGYTTLNGPYSYTIQVTDSSSPPNTFSAVFAGTTGLGSGSTSGVSITSLSPNSAAPGSQAFTITINGTGFTSNSIAYFNSTALATTFVNAGALTAVIPANLLTQALTATITVNSSGVTSNGLSFTVGTVTSTGITISCTPNVGPTTTSSYSTTCTATGGKAPYTWSITNGFLAQGLALSNSNSSQVTISGLIFVAGSQITLPYNYTLQVTDSSSPVQQATFPFAGTLSVTAVGAITSLNPITAPVGGGQFNLTVTGTGFQSGLSTVYWNGTPLQTSYISSTQLIATVPAYLLTTIGTANVSVQTSGYGTTSQVGFFVSGATAVTVAPTSLTFTYGVGGTLPPAQNLVVSSTIALSGFNLSVSALSNNITWLSATPASSATFPTTVNVSVAPGNLPIGSYNGTITVTGVGVGTGVVIPVTLNVTGPPTMVASPLSLTFSAGAGSTAPTQTIKITASDNNTLFSYNASAVANNGGSWLTVQPTSGSTPGSLTVTANAASLPAATYSGAITVTPTGSTGNPLSIPVTFTVTGPVTLSASPTSLSFTGAVGQSNPAAQSIAVSASGGSTSISYAVTTSTNSGGNWLSATASNNTTPGSISVTTNISGLAAGTYNGSVSITAGASNSPLTVPVSLVVSNQSGLTSSPSSVTFNYQIGTGGPPAQTLNITGPNGSGAYNFTVAVATTSGGSWLSASPTSGTTPGTITVTANASNLQAATYNGTLTISASGTGSVTVPVSLVVSTQSAAATLSVSPQTLTFNATAGGSAPTAQSVTVSTSNGVNVNYTVTATSTGNWLSATASGTTTGNVTVSVNPSGLAVGQYTGSLSIAAPGATNTPQTVQVTLNVTNSPSIVASPQSLAFFVPGDGSTPGPQTVTIISTGGNTSFSVSAVSQGGNWLTVSGGGQTPGSVMVTVNPTGLIAGQTYNGSITVSAPASNPNSLQVPVSLTLAPQGTVPLQGAPSVLYLSYTQGAGTDLQHVVVLNNGSGSVNYTVQGGPNGVAMGAPPSTCGNWLNVITPSGTATASIPGIVAFTVNPSGVSPQTCPGSISINTANGQTVIPVYMAVSSGTQAILLSQTAMNFVATSNGSAPAAQTFEILNPGSGTMPWTLTTSTLSGGTWLSVAPTSGNSLSLSQPGSPINVTVNPQGLAGGTYYGTVQVTSSGVPNSPQSITVAFTVLPPGANPPAQVTPYGVILTGTNGTSTSQTINITNSGTNPLSYSAILSTDDGTSWLIGSPTSGSITAGSTNAVTLSAALTNLGTGLRHGTLRLIFSDGTVQTVDVQLAVSGPASGSTGVQACGSSNLAMEFLSPQQNIQASAQVAVPLQVLVQDCNGNALTSSNTGVDVLVGSSSTDIRLSYTGNGVWAGTWTPSGANSATILTARAVELMGSSVASGAVSANVSIAAASSNAPPYVAAVVNAGSFVFPGLVAPGAMVSIFGSGLADGTVQVQSTPFPNSLQGAQFSVRGLPLPLFYASSGQVNAVMPIGLTADVRDQLIVVRDTTQSAPTDLLVADTAPGVFTVNSQGTGQAAALVGGTSQIAAPSGSIPGANAAPATAGQTISLFLSGLGTVTNPPADGSPSSASNPSLTTATPIVSIGGVAATVSYSGLAPGEVGLYQINVVIPAGTMTGDAVPVFVSIDNQNVNFVTIAIH